VHDLWERRLIVGGISPETQRRIEEEERHLDALRREALERGDWRELLTDHSMRDRDAMMDDGERAGRSSGQTVDAHLEVLVLTERSDHRFDEFAHSFNGRTLPDTDADPVIVRSGMNRERESVRQTRGDRFVLSLREPLRIGDAVYDADVHIHAP